jgi:hypothetical protein
LEEETGAPGKNPLSPKSTPEKNPEKREKNVLESPGFLKL